MKIVCTVCIGNRSLPQLGITSRQRFVKCTLGLCKNPKSDEYCLLLFTNQNKTGTKYQIKENINILSKFINDGKVTLQVKTPPHDLCLQGDCIQLKGFIHLLRRVLENKVSPKEMTYSGMSITHVATKDIAPKKLIIKNGKEFPPKGFPRTLETLCINNVKRFDVGNAILRLRQLKELDLSSNELKILPKELATLNLQELNLSSNSLCECSPQQWEWIGGNLSNSLCLLNLESNNLTYLPNEIITLRKLITLNINNNRLEVLPSGIGRLRELRILTASNNSLSRLPASIKKCRLQHLNLFNNSLNNNASSLTTYNNYQTCSLKECAAKRVLELGLWYSPQIVPRTLVYYLNHAKFCICGRPCFEIYIRASIDVPISTIAQEYVIGFNQSTVGLDCFFCSIKCFNSCKKQM